MIMDTLNYTDVNQLSLALIEAQLRLRQQQQGQQKSLLIIVSGIETAGKGQAVRQLREWLDPRYLRVKSHAPKLIENHQPIWLRYTPDLPATGQITIMFGAWYNDLFATALNPEYAFSQHDFHHYAQQIAEFEHYLMQNHTHVVKIWFDLSWKDLQKRLSKLDESGQLLHRLYGIDWHCKTQYKALKKLKKELASDWLVIDGKHQQCDQIFAENILQALQQPLAIVSCQTYQAQAIPKTLTDITPSDTRFSVEQKKQTIKQLSKKVAQLLRQEHRKVVIVLEGMDAAGKGGAIKRIVRKLDPREYDIHSIAAPEPYELRRPYLWRFWTRLEQGRKIQIFDRSWYGRVLVERIEHLIDDTQWQNAYHEINQFETQLVHHQTVVIKIWLAISDKEQLYRFEQREQTPHKRFKITPEDWRNRAKWQDYLQACADMLHYTEHPSAIWHVVATDDKYDARIQVLSAIVQRLS